MEGEGLEIMNKYLIVVDMQNDFIDGSLGTPEAQAIVDNVIHKVKHFDGTVVFTQDTHSPTYLKTQEGKHLPVEHCIKGTTGWELSPALATWQQDNGATVFEKVTFGSKALITSLVHIYETEGIESIELIGLCTDICVVSNALAIKAFLPEVPIVVDASCCAGVTPEKHRAALETMASCQVQVINQ